MNLRPSSLAKRAAILNAAEAHFLEASYDTVTMDGIAERAGVSKQTMYTHFGSKDALFIALVTAMTRAAGDGIDDRVEVIETRDEMAQVLERRMRDQLETVLDPRLLRLRRLVIGEAVRFPALASALAEHGPKRSIESLTALLDDLHQRGFLSIANRRTAASQLNWLVMGEPINAAMLLGDDAVPPARKRKAHVQAAVSTFLAAYRP